MLGFGTQKFKGFGLTAFGLCCLLGLCVQGRGMRLLLSVCTCVLVTCGVCEQAFEHDMSLLAPYLSKPKARNTEAKKP